MRLIEFKEQNIIIAKDQPEYTPLPAHLYNDRYGTLCCCWKLTLKDKLQIILKGVIWHEVLTFNQPLQPQRLSTKKPKMVK